MFTHLAWFDEFIKPRHSVSNMFGSISEESSNFDEEDSFIGEKTATSLDLDCSADSSVLSSKTTGKPKYMKHQKWMNVRWQALH